MGTRRDAPDPRTRTTARPVPVQPSSGHLTVTDSRSRSHRETIGDHCVRRSAAKHSCRPRGIPLRGPKGGRHRYVPLTLGLASALRQHRHLASDRVLCQENGRSLTRRIVQGYVRRAGRRASLQGGVHILRHTFCSHLAMRGAPVRAIQELAGHQDLSTTQRYMHLSPAAIESAIRLLDEPAPRSVSGEDTSSSERRDRNVLT